VQTAEAECGDLRWATVGLDFSGERSGGRLERRPVSTWVDDRGATFAATYQVVAGTGVPSRQGKPWETAPEPERRCGCRSTRLPKLPESTLGVTRRHADHVCVVGARRRLAGKGDLVGETGNPRVDARARPEGKIASVTIAGRTGDLLFWRATASW
jgi:hypothetical protein